MCTTLLVLCTLAGAAALTVSWLLATGNIDPGRRAEHKAGLVTSDRSKVPRRIDVAGEGKYPDIVSGKDLNRISEKEEQKEESTERMPVIEVESEAEISSDMEMSEGAKDDSADVDTVNSISDLEMENFELSDETEDFSEVQETTIEPFDDDLEITTIIY